MLEKKSPNSIKHVIEPDTCSDFIVPQNEAHSFEVHFAHENDCALLLSVNLLGMASSSKTLYVFSYFSNSASPESLYMLLESALSKISGQGERIDLQFIAANIESPVLQKVKKLFDQFKEDVKSNTWEIKIGQIPSVSLASDLFQPYVARKCTIIASGNEKKFISQNNPVISKSSLFQTIVDHFKPHSSTKTDCPAGTSFLKTHN